METGITLEQMATWLQANGLMAAGSEVTVPGDMKARVHGRVMKQAGGSRIRWAGMQAVRGLRSMEAGTILEVMAT